MLSKVYLIHKPTVHVLPMPLGTGDVMNPDPSVNIHPDISQRGELLFAKISDSYTMEIEVHTSTAI